MKKLVQWEWYDWYDNHDDDKHNQIFPYSGEQKPAVDHLDVTYMDYDNFNQQISIAVHCLYTMSTMMVWAD